MARPRGSPSRKALRLALVILIALTAAGAGAWIAVGTSIRPAALVYLLYVGVSLALGAIAVTTLVWMLDAWRTPASFAESRLDGGRLESAHSFSLIVPARHEEAVLETTLSHLVSSDHPAFEVLVVVGADDPGTREVAERVAGRHPEQVSVVIDASWPKNKPKALNAALPHCTGVITGVFDAEDAVHPDLLRRADQCFQENDADIVQAGVQLMNFRSRWWTVHNVLEYYFWFRSRLNRHARQRFIPLGGNTVFIRTQVLRAVAGWDPDCLAEDCELGVRLSSLGARTVVFYEPELVTREECPPTLRAFIRQRTRWNQGYLQTLSKGHWRNLAPPQRAIGAYILGMPFVMAVAWLLIPAAIVTAVALKAPVPITLISFLPLLPLLAMLVAEIAGLGEFCRVYGERASLRDYGRLALGLPLYQVLLTLAAARAVTRHVRGTRDWEKTTHLGQHLGQSSPTTRALAPSPAGARTAVAASAGAKTGGPAADSALDAPADTSLGEPPAAAATPGPRARPGLSAPWDAGLRAAADGNGDWHARHTHELRAAGSGEPLWARLDGAPVRGKSRPSRPKRQPVSLRAGVRWLGDVRTRLGDVVRLRPWVLLPLALIAVVAAVVGTNLLHWPATQFDEGTYVGDAWAVQSGRLAPYTYSYGHPPLAWLLIALWTSMAQIFGNVSYSVDAGREFMLLVDLVSCGLLYALARRLGFGRVAASASVLIFGLCPLALFFHRAVLLDNPSITFTIAAFLLAWTPQRRLWAFAASGACFAAGVLCKETTIVLLPALLVAVAQNADRQTRRYCLALFVSAFVLIAGFYPLYATLKGELLPGPGHVSLVGYLVVQLFTRKGTGSLFDPHSQTHAIVAAWLKLDPWLLGLALVLLPVALARRTTRAIAIAFLILVVTVLRPGYLPNMYVIGLLPFAALMVPGGIEALWRAAQGMTSRVPIWSGRAAVAGLAIAAMAVVAPHWVQGDQVATTVRLDGPQRAAEHWLLAHVSHRERLIVGDQYWIYLIAHGYDHHPMRGGFFSRTVVSYWPLDYDPAVKRAFPRGWREFNYIVETQAMWDTLRLTPTARAAIDHSRVVASFGRGPGWIKIRAIGVHPVTPHPRQTPPSRSVVPPSSPPPRGVVPPRSPAPAAGLYLIYTVRRGDTLSAIAVRHGIAGGWHSLYNANKSVIGHDPGLIYPGEHLRHP